PFCREWLWPGLWPSRKSTHPLIWLVQFRPALATASIAKACRLPVRQPHRSSPPGLGTPGVIIRLSRLRERTMLGHSLVSWGICSSYLLNLVRNHIRQLTPPPQPPRPHRLVSHSPRTARGLRSGWRRLLGTFTLLDRQHCTFARLTSRL